MDKKELVLRKLSTIALNNKITELNNIIEVQNEKNSTSYDKSKEFFTELIQNNKNLNNENLSLQKEIDNLNSKIKYQQMIIEKIPRFLLKFILKNKDIKLLNEQNN